MEAPEFREIFFVCDGATVHNLNVRGLVSDILNHPAYYTTKPSYIKQGRLWECQCACGNVVLFSEYVLANGLVKSCGCRRKSGNRRDVVRLEAQEKRLRKMKTEHEIRELQVELSIENLRDVRIRDTERIKEIGSELKRLFALKASLSRKSKPKVDEEENLT